MDAEVQELSEGLAEAVTAVREIGARLEQKHDALDIDSIKKMDETINDLGGKIGDLETMKVGQEKANKHIEAIKEQMAILAASSVGQGGKGMATPEHRHAFNNYLRQADNDGAPRYKGNLSDVADEIIQKDFYGVAEDEKDFVKKTMFAGNDGNGGFLVPSEFGGLIIARVFETSPIRSIASTMTTSAKEVEFVIDDDEAGATFVGEVEVRAVTSTPTIGQVIISAHELAARPQVTQGLLDDAGIDVEAFLGRKVGDRFTRRENNTFVVGTGSKTPQGFLNLPAWASAGVYERHKIEQVNSGTAGDFTADSFKDLKGSLTETYQPGAVWVMKRDSWTDVTKLKDSQGRFLFDMISNFRDGDSLQILGKRVVLADDMPVKAADSLSVVYGDFNEGYMIVDRIGIRVLRDPFTNPPFVRFYTTKRVGGDVLNFEALKIMKLAA